MGIIPFPVTFLLTDIVNDFYGRRGAHFLTLLGFSMAVLAWVLLQLTTVMPADSSTFFTPIEYAKVFGGSAQLFVASMVACLVGQFPTSSVFHFAKALTESRHLWLRSTGSTVFSQAINTDHDQRHFRARHRRINLGLHRLEGRARIRDRVS